MNLGGRPGFNPRPARARLETPLSYTIPEHRQGAARKAAEALRSARRVVLTTHVNADGDGTGSEIAVAAWLREQGVEAFIVNPTPWPDLFAFLIPHPSWVLPAGSDEAAEVCASADLVCVLDTGEYPRIGRVKPMVAHLPTVVIDHHPKAGQAIGGLSFRDDTAAATGEMIHDLIHIAGGPWPAAAIDGMYTAIMTDTGNFRFSNSSPEVHRVAAELVARGARPEPLYNEVYASAPMRRFRLLEACLATMDHREGVSWMTVPTESYRELGAQPDDLEGLVDYPRSLEGTEVALLFRGTNLGGTKVSFRSNGLVDVNRLAREFGGGGHVRASGALVDAGMEQAIRTVVEKTRRAVAAARNSNEDGSGS